jgi:hypothetical protein
LAREPTCALMAQGQLTLTPHPGEVAETFEYPLAHVTDPAKPERRSRDFRGETREICIWPHDRYYIRGVDHFRAGDACFRAARGLNTLLFGRIFRVAK